MTVADLRELRRLLADAQVRVDDFAHAIEQGQHDRARLCADSFLPCLQQLADEADDTIVDLKKIARSKRRTRK